MPAGTRHLQSRLKTAIGQYRDAHKSLRSASSKRSRRGLDWTNFFIADVQTGFGTYVAFYLAQRGWSHSDVGWALTIGGLAGVLSQIPGGALADATTWKRGLITVGIVTIGAAALILAFSSSFVLVLLAELLHGITAGITGRLSIGFYTSLSAGNLRAALVEYTQQFPQIEIEMIERSRTRLTSGLLNGAIDAAIVTGERALLGSSSMPLWSERLLLVLPKNHRLAEKQVVSWTDLVGEVLLLGRRDPDRPFKSISARSSFHLKIGRESF